MLVSIEWISEFVDLSGISAKELSQRVTLSTAEVEEVLEVGAHLENIAVVEIQSIRKHPEADQLNLVTFHGGNGSPIGVKEVVCGAPNVKVGMKVPYAPVGTAFPDGMVLAPKKIRGIMSEGMLCSQKELGLGENSSGLMDLGASAQLGQNLLQHLQEKKDIILNIDNKSLTHRPDLWGHFGMARELATIFQKPLKRPDLWSFENIGPFPNAKSPIVPKLEGSSSCLIYCGLSMEGVKVAPSPLWMQQRLLRVGLRPINNIVDISNYCMLELGIPLHIFDRDRIAGRKIIIKRVEKEETSFITLDGVERILGPEDTVICDENGPLVLAGIMGGKSCEVSESTTNIFIEVANWKAAEVRKTSTRLGLRTDSSQRYEKSLDSQACQRTLARTLQLILQVCPEARVLGKVEAIGPHLTAPAPLRISTSYESINKKLGRAVDPSRVRGIFTSLDFKVQEDRGILQVEVPSFRSTKDVEMEADLIEEIGRIIGYDNIPPTAPMGEIHATSFSEAKILGRKIADFMVLNGRALQVTSYPLVGAKLLERAKWPGSGNEELVLVNSLSVEHDRMRPSMVPSLLEMASLNQKHFEVFRFFELGRSYLPHPQNFSQEFSQLGFVFYHKQSSLFMEAVNVLERLLNYINIPFDLVAEGEAPGKNAVIPAEWSGRHPHEYLHIRIMGKFQGALTTIHPAVLKNFKMGGHVTLAVLDLTTFENQKRKDRVLYRPLSKFPVSEFDCTVVTGQNTPVGDILKTFRKLKIKEMVSYKVVGVFPLSEEEKSVTLRCVFADPEKTLSGEFIKASSDSVVKNLEAAGFKLKT